MFHRDRIQEFHDRTSFRRLGLAGCPGRGLSPAWPVPVCQGGLSFLVSIVPQRGPVVTKPRQQKKRQLARLLRRDSVQSPPSASAGSPGLGGLTAEGTAASHPTPPHLTNSKPNSSCQPPHFAEAVRCTQTLTAFLGALTTRIVLGHLEDGDQVSQSLSRELQ